MFLIYGTIKLYHLKTTFCLSPMTKNCGPSHYTLRWASYCISIVLVVIYFWGDFISRKNYSTTTLFEEKVMIRYCSTYIYIYIYIYILRDFISRKNYTTTTLFDEKVIICYCSTRIFNIKTIATGYI